MPIKLPEEMKTGTIHKTKSYGDIKILEVNGSLSVKVKFIDTGYETITSLGNIRKGLVKDRFFPVVHGVGYIGGERFKCTGNGGKQLSYNKWTNMLGRCYDKNRQESQPTYAGCTVCDEWLNYQNFAGWFNSNHDGSKVQLDKDLLFVGNKHYSPETCILVPRWLNSFTLDHGAARGEYPIGVSYVKRIGRFRAYCNDEGSRVEFGTYETPEAAHQAWKKYKLGLALKRKIEMDEIDIRIYPNVVKIIESAR